MARSSAETREHVLAVTNDLFYWQGIRATGVDRVAAQAGVAPTTLYRLFASKDDLVAAYIERAGRLYREWFDAAAATGGPDPRGQILAVFDALGEQVQPQQCRGCPFLMALAEFPDPEHPAHRAAVAVKAWVRDRLGQLTAALTADLTDGPADGLAASGGRDGLLADHLSLLLEGVYASAQALSARGPARHARVLAESLLNAA
jgi:AcrR family transcriptional regulator